MKKMIKFSTFILILSFVLALTACSASSGTDSKIKEVKVGVVGNSDDPIWEQVNKNLKKENIQVKLVKFTDGIIANQSQDNKELDLTAFQHYAFLNQEKKQKGYKFTVIAQSYIVPLNVYSKKIKNLKQIKSGDKIAIPNNVTNAGRALKVLESAGLIKLDPSKGYSPAVKDITENKKNVKIVEVDPAKIPSLLPDFAAGITNSNFIIDNKMNPVTDSIYRIKPDLDDPNNKPWINVIVARTADKNNKTYKKVVDAYHTASVANKIKKLYNGVYVPAFKY
ncbi:MetQ/NlpA family ABC transporter substrate-binding protein [Sporolactobacillus shoreicorticis]|uniref:Lipoprotein n=1 Tax=Sporolactobacillus shoreicorticis TaxID=1923877 RepID=A0ABW5S3H3_9BACL|nr:MetQ/NlpA family ABC transporter substrate-binding protein [Sporolactobacillus shoreicorticis]MCO7124286.1 MetQ/NlpA family ABC transporter substrate-binding protein [Sporolactobacillus shoreicorticis]